MDNDFQVSGPVVAIRGGGVGCNLQLWGVAGLQPLGARHPLDRLHPFFAYAGHLTAEVLHFLVIDGTELMKTWWCWKEKNYFSHINKKSVQITRCVLEPFS